MSDLIDGLREDFQNKEYRHSYVDEFLNAWIATQIKVLREQRGWSQKELAERADMLQPRISALENVNYSSWSVKTLRKLAEAFDLTLHISFEEFSDWIKDFELFDKDYLQRRSFDDDPALTIRNIQSDKESIALSEVKKDIRNYNVLEFGVKHRKIQMAAKADKDFMIENVWRGSNWPRPQGHYGER